MPIAQTTIAWSSFAPELALAGVALFLLLYGVAGPYRVLAAVAAGAVAAGTGAWLVLAGHPLPGAVALALGAGGIAAAVALRDRPELVNAWLASAAAAGALTLTGWQWVTLLSPEGGRATASVTMEGAIALDGIAFFTRVTVLVTVLLVVPIGYGYLRERGIYRSDFEPLVLLSATGMTLLGAAGDLVVVFVALEVLSIALYVLCGLARRDRRSQEASLKYFVMGAIASAILLYGMALLYVATGSVRLAAIGEALALTTTDLTVGVLGVALVTVGFGFKVALAPFHLWIPDVYQGAPTNVTAFMAAATKAAGFAAVLRLFLQAFGALEELWVPVLAVVAAVTMMYGAVVAVVQHDVKRLLAYSSVAHAGYAAVGVVAASEQGLSATLWYLLTYAVTVLAAFGCVVAIERRREGEVTIADLRGLGRRAPALAGMLALSLLSLAGIPPTAGFAGKWVVFAAGVGAGLEWLVVVGVVSSAVAAFYYLRLMAAMFLEEGEEVEALPVVTSGLSTGVAAAAAGVLVLGILPSTLLTLAENAAVIAR